MAIFLDEVKTAPPNLNKRFMKRGQQKEQNRIYNQQKALKQIATHLDDQAKLGMDMEAHETFCNRISYLQHQLTTHEMSKGLLQNLNSSLTNAEYRTELHNKVKEALTELAKSATKLRQQHDKESCNKARTGFRKTMATNSKAAHRSSIRRKTPTTTQWHPTQPSGTLKQATS